MRITSIETLCATRLHERADHWVTDRYRSIKADIAVVSIRTDTGHRGIGEACSYGNPLKIADWVQWYSAALVGTEVDDVRAHPHPTGTAFSKISPSAHDYAVAGIDTALWDLRAQQAGLPLSKLLNPAADDLVMVYASGGVRFDWRSNPFSLIDDVAGYVHAGYRTVKIRLGTHWGWDAVTPERFLDLFDALRAEVGDAVGIAVDGNCRLTREEARILARGLDDRGALWFEEPLDNTDLEGYAELNRSVGLKISGGESFTTQEQFRPWLESGALSIVQPDAGVCGVTELMKIGALAQREGAELIPHSWHNGVMAMANAHAVAALPNAPLLEECMVQGPLKWGVVEGGTRVSDGEIRLGDRVGLGIDIIPDLESQYPYVEGHYSVEVLR
jgi:L-alanine-DL-glutamate epimerase-like enolase superfamily enzyme